MSIFSFLSGEDLSSPIEAIGNAFDKIFTSDEEREQARIVFEKLKQHPEELRAQFETLKLKLDTEDKHSARQREVALHDKMPAFLAVSVTLGFFGVLFWMMVDTTLDTTYRDILNIMVGSLGTAWIGVINYYFGGSVIQR